MLLIEIESNQPYSSYAFKLKIIKNEYNDFSLNGFNSKVYFKIEINEVFSIKCEYFLLVLINIVINI